MSDFNVPPPEDDSPLARLAHTIAVYDSQPEHRPADDKWAIVATQNHYARGEHPHATTGLTWGDLRALCEVLQP